MEDFINDYDKRLDKLEKDLSGKAEVCSSGGVIHAFPDNFNHAFRSFGIGLIVCSRGQFNFSLSKESYTAVAGESVFIPNGASFYISGYSEDIEVSIIMYKVDGIKDVLGNMVYSVDLYTKMSPQTYYVWTTGEEEDVAGYISLIGNKTISDDDLFAMTERRLLLLSLTYRLCSIFQKKYLSKKSSSARRTEIFLRLIQLIDRNYMSQRGVEFYADKMFLSPKYLSELCKSVCGYTVQELVFKAIIRKSMSMLDGTNKTVQEISEDLNFPNASSFGTFFKKHVGVSPQKYREKIE